jgi:hypothetical protein
MSRIASVCSSETRARSRSSPPRSCGSRLSRLTARPAGGCSTGRYRGTGRAGGARLEDGESRAVGDEQLGGGEPVDRGHRRAEARRRVPRQRPALPAHLRPPSSAALAPREGMRGALGPQLENFLNPSTYRLTSKIREAPPSGDRGHGGGRTRGRVRAWARRTALEESGKPRWVSEPTATRPGLKGEKEGRVSGTHRADCACSRPPGSPATPPACRPPARAPPPLPPPRSESSSDAKMRTSGDTARGAGGSGARAQNEWHDRGL